MTRKAKVRTPCCAPFMQVGRGFLAGPAQTTGVTSEGAGFDLRAFFRLTFEGERIKMGT